MSAVEIGVSITAMGEHDLLEVVELEERTRLSRWGWEAYHQELQAAVGPIMMVARYSESRSSSKVVGFIAARVTGDELHINNIAVSYEFQGKGVGGALMDAVLSEALTRSSASRALLEVRKSNKAARALYESRGFKIVGERKNYYHNPLEDAVVMALDRLRNA